MNVGGAALDSRKQGGGATVGGGGALRANNDVATRSMNCRHPVVLLLLPLLTPMIFFFRPQGSAHVLDACHKCGSGRDRTPTMHLHSGNKGYIKFDKAT